MFRAFLLPLLLASVCLAFRAEADTETLFCLEALLRKSELPRPLAEASGAEVEALVRSREGDRAVHPAVWGLLTTADGTVAPVLGGRKAPPWLSQRARALKSSIGALPWDRLSADEQMRLVEHVGRRLAEAEGQDTVERGAYVRFHDRSRSIPGLVVRPTVDAVVPAGPGVFIFGKGYAPGAARVSLEGIETAVEFGRPKDMLQLELVELHFRTRDGQPISPGETALSVRNLLAARGYPRGKQHQHAIGAKAPRARAFGRGVRGNVMATALATKLVADANLLMELLAVGLLHKPIEARENESGLNCAPLEAGALPDLTEFLWLLASEDDRAEDELFHSLFKTFSVGVRGPAKFPGRRWSLEFRLLYPALLQRYGKALVAPMIDQAKSKMQILSAQIPGGLEEDRAALLRWFRDPGLQFPNAESADMLGRMFAEGWPHRSRESALAVAPPSVLSALEPSARAFFLDEGLWRYELNWLLHDWSRSHWAHLGRTVEWNAAVLDRIVKAQVRAVRRLASPHRNVDSVLYQFVFDSGLLPLAVFSLGLR